MKIVYIMRGVPGSGKSTVAHELIKDGGVVHSTDDYRYIDGKYHFDPTKSQECHDLNYQAFCSSLEQGVSVVICDNTNIKRWHFKRYIEAAEKAGYLVAVVTMPHPDPQVATQRTIHDVPAPAIEIMIKGWED